MSNVRSLLARRFSSTDALEVLSRPQRRARRVRAGKIGPIRREIIFEPLPDDPVPAEPSPVTPEKPQEQPVPARR